MDKNYLKAASAPDLLQNWLSLSEVPYLYTKNPYAN